MVDVQKLVTVANYATRVGKTRQAVYFQVKQGKVQSIAIDGVIFVKI